MLLSRDSWNLKKGKTERKGIKMKELDLLKTDAFLRASEKIEAQKVDLRTHGKVLIFLKNNCTREEKQAYLAYKEAEDRLL